MRLYMRNAELYRNKSTRFRWQVVVIVFFFRWLDDGLDNGLVRLYGWGYKISWWQWELNKPFELKRLGAKELFFCLWGWMWVLSFMSFLFWFFGGVALSDLGGKKVFMFLYFYKGPLLVRFFRGVSSRSCIFSVVLFCMVIWYLCCL